MGEHDTALARVAALIERAHMLRADAGETGTPVTWGGLTSIVHGALVALELGSLQAAKVLLAGYLAMVAETTQRADGQHLN